MALITVTLNAVMVDSVAVITVTLKSVMVNEVG